jgi:TRAP-type C4-dicarboxylate transport system permease small subunit
VNESSPEDATPGAEFYIPIYDGALKLLEIWILSIALLVVIGASALNIVFRNLEWAVWNPTVVNQIVYALTFYLGIFGGVIAARRAQHISVDALSHYMSDRLRNSLGVILQLAGAATCLVLMSLAHEWVGKIEADDFLVPRMPKWWLQRQLWLWPMVCAFGLMTLHFVVNAIRRGVAVSCPADADPSVGEED